jgi:ABC-type branched-subunit amino acid transport system ATPase component
MRESVDVLTAAVGGNQRRPVAPTEKGSAEFAAAALVAKASGLKVDDDALSRATSDIETGRSPIESLAWACGARPRKIALESGWRSRDGRPLVAWLKGQTATAREVVALVPGRKWSVVDPLTGSSRPVTDDIAEVLDVEAYELLPLLPPEPVTQRNLLRLGSLGSRADVTWILLMTAAVGGMAFVTPFLFGQLANLFTTSAQASAYIALFVALFLTIAANTVWGGVRSLALLRVRARSVGMAVSAMWDRMVRQRAVWHSSQPLGDRMAQANAVSGASMAVPDETVSKLLDTVIVLGSLAAVATTGIPLLLGIIALLAVQIVIMSGLLKVASRRAAERIDATATATGRLLEILKAVNRLRVAGAESRAFLRWAGVQARLARADQSLRRVAMIQGLVVAIWPILGLMVIVLVTNATGAGFQSFITSQTASAAAIASIAATTLSANAVIIARRALDKAAPLLESAPEGGGEGVQPGLLSGGIEVRDIVFRYAHDLPPVLDKVSVSIRPGEHVAIVGPSGCGKTTLMRVILGLEDPESGVIAVDGRDMASLDRPAVRRQIGSVLQSSQLLPGPLQSNVDMGRGMTATEIWQALDDASVGADVRAMPMGLDTPVSDGMGTISGGQRQRILIARALAGGPRILVLDEATSALDNITQAAVVESLENLRITRVVVAHRLSTIRHADRIIVLEAGRVVDEGTYDELFAREGTFRELALRQQL